jgi:hypothetical protein
MWPADSTRDAWAATRISLYLDVFVRLGGTVPGLSDRQIRRALNMRRNRLRRLRERT